MAQIFEPNLSNGIDPKSDPYNTTKHSSVRAHPTNSTLKICFGQYIVTFDQVYGFCPTLTKIGFQIEVELTRSANQRSSLRPPAPKTVQP